MTRRTGKRGAADAVTGRAGEAGTVTGRTGKRGAADAVTGRAGEAGTVTGRTGEAEIVTDGNAAIGGRG